MTRQHMSVLLLILIVSARPTIPNHLRAHGSNHSYQQAGYGGSG